MSGAPEPHLGVLFFFFFEGGGGGVGGVGGGGGAFVGWYFCLFFVFGGGGPFVGGYFFLVFFWGGWGVGGDGNPLLDVLFVFVGGFSVGLV